MTSFPCDVTREQKCCQAKRTFLLMRILSRESFMNLLLSSARPLARYLSTTSSAQKPIRWGILSAGKISSDFTKAISITEGAQVRTSFKLGNNAKSSAFLSLLLLLFYIDRLLQLRLARQARLKSLLPSMTFQCRMEATTNS